MALDPTMVVAAQATQDAAAHDLSHQVRLVAGPGTGKSRSIEERIRWLLDSGVNPVSIWAISFTRASTNDLASRIRDYCNSCGHPDVMSVNIRTLHSLGLRILREAGILRQSYPVDPLVLDNWEVENIFDAEFGNKYSIGKDRREEIRKEHEAFWNTGQWTPTNYVPPTPPISPAERSLFNSFHLPRTHTYSCVLPGEIVRKCVERMSTGTLDARNLLTIDHLVVDEYQDLNQMDLDFIDILAQQGVDLFVAGDDDQSVYSFRHALPSGIQSFQTKYPHSGNHSLEHCFRCPPEILSTGLSIINGNPQQNRIAKTLTSLYLTAVPPANGIKYLWGFSSHVAEARAIAQSCRDLIQATLNPRDILILVSDKRILLPKLEEELIQAGVAFESPREIGYSETDPGRFILSLLRILCSPDDYVAHRTLLGMMPQAGIKTLVAIADAVITNNMRYRSLFYQPLPLNIFTTRASKVINSAQIICAQLQTWSANETLGMRNTDILALLQSVFGVTAVQSWQTLSAVFPQDTLLKEIRDYLWSTTDDQRLTILNQIHTRLNLPTPGAGTMPPRIRLMSMHGAKGLSAKIVFIPGLEEEIFPGPRRQPYAGLILEAARLLYVSITRARALCVLSFASWRAIFGSSQQQTPSRFTAQLNGAFTNRNAGLTAQELQLVLNEIALL